MFFLQVILGLVILLFEVRREKAQIVDIMAIFNLLFLLCYVIAPIAGYYMLPNWYEYSVMRYTIKGADYESASFYYSGLIALFGYLIFIFSYVNYVPKFRSKFLNAIFLNNFNNKRLFIYGVVLFSISFLAILISSVNSGGLINWIIANPRLYFTDEAGDVEASSWGMDKLSQLMLFSCYLFWGLFMIRRNKFQNYHTINRFLVLFFLISSFLLSTAVAIHVGGRLFFFKFFATFLIAHMYIGKKSISTLKISLLIIFGVVSVLYGRLVFKFLIYRDFVEERVSSIDDTLQQQFFGFINNYTFTFYSLTNNLKYGSDNFKLFGDLFTWPFQFLPPSVRPDNLPYSTKLNTFRLMDLKDTGIIPSDILSYGVINGHVFGVIIVVSLFGIVVKIINTYSFRIVNPVSAILFVALAFVIGFRVMYFDPAHLFKGSFDIIVGLIGVSIISRLK